MFLCEIDKASWKSDNVKMSLIDTTTDGTSELARAVFEHNGTTCYAHNSFDGTLRATHNITARCRRHICYRDTGLARHHQEPLWQERTSAWNDRRSLEVSQIYVEIRVRPKARPSQNPTEPASILSLSGGDA